MFYVLRLIIVGLFFGWLARWFYPGTVPMGWIATILLGLAGSFGGGLLAKLFSARRGRGVEPAGCLGSVLGAMLLIFLGRIFNVM
ncbi:MAG: GlsB/YeaQ/YmgE family stress response membrane protein [Sphingobium sp.]